MLVTFHGVRGSTPCHGDEIARYGGNTSCVSVDVADGEEPMLFDLGTGLRYFGLKCGDEPFRGTAWSATSTGITSRGCRSSRPLLHPETELDVYAPSRRTVAPPPRCWRPRSARRCSRSGSQDFPGRIDVREPADDVPRRRVRRRELPSSRTSVSRRLPGDVRRHQRRLHQRPPAADVRRPHRRRGARAVPRRRPADPRRPVHAGRVLAEEHVGSLHGRVRGVAGRRGRRPAAGAVPPRPDPRRRHARSPRRGGRDVRPRRWASRCSPPARASPSSSSRS